MSTKLFESHFGTATAFGTKTFFGSGWWQYFSGTDNATGFNWSDTVLGGTLSHFQIVGIPVNESNDQDYMFQRIENTTGHLGSTVPALYQQTTQLPVNESQNVFGIQNVNHSGDFYFRMYIKFQPNLATVMLPQTWKSVTGFKSSGDFRINLLVETWGNVAPFWTCMADNNANGGLPLQEFWRVERRDLPVLVSPNWNKVEWFLHRANDASGRYWCAVNDTVVVDRFGDNIGVNSNPVNRLWFPALYIATTQLPVYQWIDHIEIWDGFPTADPTDPDPDISGSPNRYDSFNRANNTGTPGSPSDGGSAWEVLFGVFGILDNKLYQPSTLSSITVLQHTTANCDVSVNLYGPGDNIGIVGRVTDATNYILLVYTPGLLRIYKRVAGSHTLLASSGLVNMVSGDKLTLRMTEFDFLEGRINDVAVVSVTDGFGGGVTKHGVRGDTTYTGTFNNFTITNLATAPPPTPPDTEPSWSKLNRRGRNRRL